MARQVEVDFYNTYVLRKVNSAYRVVKVGSDFNYSPTQAVTWGIAPLGIGYDTQSFPNVDARRWYIEESRIRGGFNNTSTGQGVRAYLDDENPLQQRRVNTLIYSGIYNSRTGINQTNVFSVGDDITKSVDISFGSIQKTYSEDTNLIIFQENRIQRALIDKDTIYTTESGTQTQAGAAVIGQFVPYKGEYGISKNPESFAIYNYRKYFSDKNRNAVMRLSNDGLTEISMYGMQDYFRDNLAEIDISNTQQSFTATQSGGGATSETFVSVTTSTITTGQNITPGMQISLAGVVQPGYITYVEISGGNTNIFYSQLFTS
jgi:hypothetical protein